MPISLVRRVGGCGRRLVVNLWLLLVAIALMLMGLLVVIHLLAHLALHVLVLYVGVAPVHLALAVPAHIVLGGLRSPITCESRLFVRLQGLRLVAFFEPGIFVSLGGGTIAHDHSATFGSPPHHYLLM